MPGNVANAIASTVLPQSLCCAFVHTREYPLIENEYRNGESQRSAQAATSGRYTVRFNTDWSQSVGPGRSDVQIELIELA
jgi:hypothetical protein